MITVENINEVDPDEYDEIWIIMRSKDSVNAIVANSEKAKWVPELSPSEELFSWYLKKKKSFQWSDEIFHKEYVPQFLREMKNPEAYNKLKQLYHLQKEKNICIGCSCALERRCHRSIIGGILSAAGASVKNGYGISFEKYARLYGPAYFEQ